jgi:4-hydroxymandelate oxidase
VKLNLTDYEIEARSVLPSHVYDFIAGGSCDQVTVQECCLAFSRWRFVPRILRGHKNISTATTILGHPISLPVLVAPWAAQKLCHPAGEIATARAAKKAGTIFTLATPSTVHMEDVAAEADHWWFQLYIFRDRGFTRDLVLRAAAAGASALVVTVDMPVFGRREADERNRFALPSEMSLVHFPPKEHFGLPDTGSAVAISTNSLIDPGIAWADLEWLASLSPLPIVVKGVLHADDARQAVDVGARALIVSNHGGRQLDSAITSLDALPKVVEAIDGRAEVLVDGGVRRGSDVLKALALGARAVMVGRPIAWGLAVNGEDGVLHVLSILREELQRDLHLSGCSSPAVLDRTLLTPALSAPTSVARWY